MRDTSLDKTYMYVAGGAGRSLLWRNGSRIQYDRGERVTRY